MHRILLTALLATLALAPVAGASPRAHSAAAERAAEASIEEAEDLLDGDGVRTGRELTDALREVSTGLRHLRGDERERAIGLLARPTDDEDPDAFDPSLLLRRDCSTNFCVSWVDSGADAATAADAARALAEAEAVHAFETGVLGWREPPSDGDGRVDIYLKELGSQKLFGYAATDANQECCSQSSYLVVDNDFDPAQYGGIPALEALRVTLAHEYGHVLQYGYDVTADGWHYEASAVWLEQRMYPHVKDWLRFVQDRPTGEAGWRSLTELPLTAYAAGSADGHPDPRNAKPYGNVVWNDFLSTRYGARGDDLQRRSWESSDGLERPSTAAYDSAIRELGGRGVSSDYAAFAAAVAEWRARDSPFLDARLLPDVERRDSLAVDGAFVAPSMDHLSFALYDVPSTSGPSIRLSASFPTGTSGALALVARSGALDSGRVTTRLLELPEGGVGEVTLDRPASFNAAGGRVTAVLVNTDSTQSGWSERVGDWVWSRDGQRVVARITADTARPRASLAVTRSSFRLRSVDDDRLKWTATLRKAGRTIGTRRGSLATGSKRKLRLPRGSFRGRARLVVVLTDPQGNTTRLRAWIRRAGRSSAAGA